MYDIYGAFVITHLFNPRELTQFMIESFQLISRCYSVD